MIRIHKFCDHCARELGEKEQFNHLTITHDTAPTTWDICAECSKAIFEELEKRFAYTRGRALKIDEEMEITNAE